MSYQRKDAARRTRAQWMEQFETACIKLCPKVRGRVDWNTATYYYLKGETPTEAAAKWINNIEVS